LRSRNWDTAPVDEITDCLCSITDNVILPELDRLESSLSAVCMGHGDAHPELLRVLTLFHWLKCDLLHHIIKEQQALFPLVGRMSRSLQGRSSSSGSVCSVRKSVRLMMAEHDSMAELMRAINSATSGFTAPPDACPAHRLLYDNLLSFLASVQRLFQVENYILFPRAVEIETCYGAKNA
jgi:regulator of cell morphogenesis and NO signaling